MSSYEKEAAMAYEETRADVPMRNPETSIQGQIESLHNTHDMLGATVQKVIDHFSPVCTEPYPEPTDGNKGTDMDRMPQAQLTAQIATAVTHAQRMIGQLSTLLERSQL